MATAIVTGASQGLGAALAVGLARSGWSLVIDARHGARLHSAAASMRRASDAGGRVVDVVGDITDPGHRRELIAAARALGGVDLVVNNASTLGSSPLPPLRTYPLPTVRDVLEANVVAPLALLQEALSDLSASPDPRVINVTSDASVEAYEGWGGYGSSKARARPHQCRAGPGGAASAGVGGRSRRHADPDAPGRLSGRGHLGPARSGIGRPALLELIAGDRPSGRYRAVDLQSAMAGVRP